jgi:hypothetical protein
VRPEPASKGAACPLALHYQFVTEPLRGRGAAWRSISSVIGPMCGVVQLRQLLTLGAQPDEIRRAYRRCGVRFDVDTQGALTMRLDLAPDEALCIPKNIPN